MKTKPIAFILILLSTLITTSGQILWKFGSNNLPNIITNWPLIFGFALYGLGATILIFALKNGQLSTLYPIYATSYIWVSLSSVYFFNEILNTSKIFGIITIIIGVSFIGFGDKSDWIMGNNCSIFWKHNWSIR